MTRVTTIINLPWPMDPQLPSTSKTGSIALTKWKNLAIAVVCTVANTALIHPKTGGGIYRDNKIVLLTRTMVKES